MNGTIHDGERIDDETMRWLIVEDAPALSGASAAAAVELLWAMADAIDLEYAAEIIGYQQRDRATEPPPWSLSTDEHPLTLDLGDEDYFQEEDPARRIIVVTRVGVRPSDNAIRMPSDILNALRAHGEAIALMSDVLVDNGVRGAGFLHRERMRSSGRDDDRSSTRQDVACDAT